MNILRALEMSPGMLRRDISRRFIIIINIIIIWQSYKQTGGCLVHFACLADTLLEDEESARHNPPVCL